MNKLSVTCKDLAERILADVAKASRQFYTVTGRVPELAIYANETEAGSAYVRSKERACQKVGINCRVVRVGGYTSPNAVCQVIAQDQADAIIVQLPLFGGKLDRVVVDSVPVDKDADGLVLNSHVFPATASGIIRLLYVNGFMPLSGQHVVVIGRSALVGEPLAKSLAFSTHATVSVCNSRTPPTLLRALTRTADVIVSAVGKANFLTADMVAPGALVVDVGINRGADGKLCGDVAKGVSEIATVTPVPGGVGLLTVACLLDNVMTLTKNGATKNASL